jgi:hypothetical protein
MLGTSSLDPGSCPVPSATDEVIDVTVVAVEHATYTCAVDKSRPQGGVLHRCVSVYSGGCTFTLRGSDGSERTATSSADPAIGGGWCDVPAGHYDIALCTRLGPLPCSVDVAEDDHQVLVGPHSSLPFPRRYRARSSSGDLVFDAGYAELEVGDRRRLTLHRNREQPVPRLGPCDVAMIPTPAPAPAHGCATCDSGEPDVPTVALVAFVLATWTRRRTS